MPVIMFDFGKLPKDELICLQNISVGFDTLDSSFVYQKLEKKGLIEEIGVQPVGTDGFGMIELPVWEMPLAVHIDWCRYCAELPDDFEFSR